MSALNQIHSYSFPTDIKFGPGVVKMLPDHLAGLGFSKPLIVTDGNIVNLEFVQKIISNLKNAGMSVTIFHEMHKNPVASDVIKGDGAFKGGGCDCVVGLGGGVAMDVARAIVLRVNHHRDLFDYDDLEGGWKYVTEEVPYFVTIPTTSGTGSEVGRSAIISEDESKRKRILFHPKLLARQVFADPELTYDLPPAITAATGMDALTHNVEAFLAKGFHPMADGIALEAISLIGEHIEDSVKKGNPESRAAMMLASLMGAVAFQKGLGLVHSLAHPLSTLVDMHHGLANAMMIPFGMEYNEVGNEEKFGRIAKALGTTESIPKFLRELNDRIDVPSNLGSQGVESEHVEQLVELAMNDFCLPANPREVSADAVREIYKRAL